MTRRAPNSSRPVRPSSTPARRNGIPLTPLAQQMLQDMQLARLAERTHESYLRAVRKFAQWLNKSPQVATENDLRRYVLLIKNDHVALAGPHAQGPTVCHWFRQCFPEPPTSIRIAPQTPGRMANRRP